MNGTTEETERVVWTGEWVAGRLGVSLSGGDELPELLGLALRRNPKRAHLLVSNVLGKHVPQRPGVVHGAGYRLGCRVRELLGDEAAARSVVLGYAETATGLGHSVADGLACAPYLHSTRRPVDGVAQAGGFEEEHSHATSHLLLPEDTELLAGDGPLVLVDDEFSTGRTVLNTIRALHARFPRERYVVVALVDMRSAADRGHLEEFAAELGARVDLVALASGGVRLPADVLDRGRRLVAEHEAATAGGPASAPETAPGAVHRAEPVRVDLGWPAGLPDGGRHGFTPAHRARLEARLPGMAARIARHLDGARRVLVLGNEELMYAPLRLAEALDARLAEATDAGPTPRTGDPATTTTADPGVYFSTTTRSPVLAVDDPGYAIRTRLSFPAHDLPTDGPGERYAYNVAAGSDPERRFDAIVAVVDGYGDRPELHAPGGLLDRLAEHTDRLLLTVIPSHTPRPQAPTMSLPEPLRGPAFSSYAADEVGWLLQDLSDVTLEAPTEEREEAIQNGGAHYAESLPVEYQPSEQYQALFHSALRASASRIAQAVGTVTESVLAERTKNPVLVSLARAGTPVGVLMRRWARHAHGLELPHYAVSIVRGRGIDTTALRWLAAHHDPADVVFVDGWTGKGAITRELAEALADFPGFDPRIAVLADPGGCVETYGTRDDFLIPSACLNSTVSGLISRTVLRDDLVGPDDFHGAKFYRDLATADLSRAFLDAISAHFDDVTEAVAAEVKALAAADRAPTWAGWAAVERISAEYGIHDVNLVKPGVGETTRVLLRRVPWKILARQGAGADLDHVRLLAEQRGVPVEEVDELPYTCVGLIHPRFTRGATGADGKAVASR
ncbi:hypoxanthine-guanine phosphoribosyltransferase [Streptomyces sp. NBRC 110611]|uniref:phosphoribosyltransferase n=1 Tax=Streptomyces sp. NBRC 110611 TaxID=1621259 RepID=UPI00082C36C1|nr:phosphoribosyltransferase [Streptomyces sp. NBRC 110611]GAU70934.1 hypoxanthine-guanine phosphoribosyltransferase [Streptomyces sp. NBRC 110611]